MSLSYGLPVSWRSAAASKKKNAFQAKIAQGKQLRQLKLPTQPSGEIVVAVLQSSCWVCCHKNLILVELSTSQAAILPSPLCS